MRGALQLSILASALGVLLLPGGCVFESKQVIVTYDIQPDSLQSGTTAPISAVQVDLNTVSAYRERSGEIRGVADAAFLGIMHNTTPTFTRIEWWVTPDETHYTTPAQVRLNADLLWAGPELPSLARLALEWNKSAGNTDRQVMAALLPELSGDGRFTLYAIGSLTGTSYGFAAVNTSLVFVLETQP